MLVGPIQFCLAPPTYKPGGIVVKPSRPHQSAPTQAGACTKLMAMATFSFAAYLTHMGSGCGADSASGTSSQVASSVSLFKRSAKL